jgi:ligand-binding SRPBCC domain-containing protein
MTTLTAITIITAPIELCFRSALSIDLELIAAKDCGIRAINGITTGIIGAGERVTWQTRQFGLWITHTSEITGFDAPVFFQDSMVKGLFDSYEHNHFFRLISATTTEMRDELRFSMPIWLTGPIAERLIVKRRLASLLSKRNDVIRQDAEAASGQASEGFRVRQNPAS